MRIEILQLLEGAKKASGLAVVIDVFRAFTTACYLVQSGAKYIIPVADLDRAYQLQEQFPDAFLVGERNGIKPEGFHFGNSPSEVEHKDLSGKIIILTTSAGTQGFRLASHAEEMLTGSLVNASAIAAYIRVKNPDTVSLVCMGHRAQAPAEEDTLCAEYIRDLLLQRTIDINKLVERLKACNQAQKFYDNEKLWAPERDLELCSAVDKFSFVLKLITVDNGPQQLEKLPVRLTGTRTENDTSPSTNTCN